VTGCAQLAAGHPGQAGGVVWLIDELLGHLDARPGAIECIYLTQPLDIWRGRRLIDESFRHRTNHLEDRVVKHR
jgi:hypothetical protein